MTESLMTAVETVIVSAVLPEAVWETVAATQTIQRGPHPTPAMSGNLSSTPGTFPVTRGTHETHGKADSMQEAGIRVTQGTVEIRETGGIYVTSGEALTVGIRET